MFVGKYFFHEVPEEFPLNTQEVIKMFGMPVDVAARHLQVSGDVAAYLKDHSLMQVFTDEGVSPELLGEIIEWKTIKSQDI